MMPLFSIIIPCYNQSHFLNDAIHSVLAQDFTDLEILIINDGSTDETKQTGEYFAGTDSRIRIISQTNKGLSNARNTGITNSSGQYLHFLDADDWVLPRCYSEIEKRITNKSLEVIGVGYSYRTEINSEPMQVVIPSSSKSVYPEVLEANIGPCHSFFVPRQLVLELGMFDESLKSGEDWDLWIRLAKTDVEFSFIEKEFVVYRYVPDSMSRNGFQMYQELKKVFLRGISFDDRIGENFIRNKEHQINSADALKRILIQCLGITVLQGLLLDSIQLLEKEKLSFKMFFFPIDFKVMNSYLTFRYWKDADSLKALLEKNEPVFKSFFQHIFSQEKEVKSALSNVFQPARKRLNHARFGSLLGSIINRTI
jgi:glycosyltransferase involved in cell wall biosynthesis